MIKKVRVFNNKARISNDDNIQCKESKHYIVIFNRILIDTDIEEDFFRDEYRMNFFEKLNIF